MMDRQALNARKRAWRKATENAATKKYERTKKGKLMRIYRNMESRIKGVQTKKYHLYAGKSLLGRDEFYQWAMCSSDFHRLFSEWEKSGHDRKLAPSVDRLDTSKGYEIGNIEWVTHSENSRRGGLWRKHGEVSRRTVVPHG